MPEVFVSELHHQRRLAERRMRHARRLQDDALAEAMAERLSDLDRIARCNGVDL